MSYWAYFQEHQGLKSSCSPHKYTSAWATIHKRCTLGAPSSTWRWLQDLWTLLGFRSFLRLGCFIHFLSFRGMYQLGHNVSTQNVSTQCIYIKSKTSYWSTTKCFKTVIQSSIKNKNGDSYRFALGIYSAPSVLLRNCHYAKNPNEHRWEVKSLEVRIQPGNTDLMAKTI